MYEMLKEFIKPELYILIPVIYFMGMGFKKSDSVADKLIPRKLTYASVALSLLFVLTTSDISRWQDVLMSLFVGITQGVLCAAASVYVNQLIKQSGKDE